MDLQFNRPPQHRQSDKINRQHKGVSTSLGQTLQPDRTGNNWRGSCPVGTWNRLLPVRFQVQGAEQTELENPTEITLNSLFTLACCRLWFLACPAKEFHGCLIMPRRQSHKNLLLNKESYDGIKQKKLLRISKNLPKRCLFVRDIKLMGGAHIFLISLVDKSVFINDGILKHWDHVGHQSSSAFNIGEYFK